MTRLLTGPKGPLAVPFDLFAVGRSAWNFAKIVARRMRNRRAVVQLLDWDDRALKDIGLTRADVRLSLALPMNEDPSARLMSWALERRSARLMRRVDYDEPVGRPRLRVLSGRSRSSSASTSRA